MKKMTGLEAIATCYSRVFATIEGKIILDHLDQSFCNKRLTSNRTSEQIIASAAMHDTVRFIHDMVAMGNLTPAQKGEK